MNSNYDIILPEIQSAPCLFDLPKEIRDIELCFSDQMCPIFIYSKVTHRKAVWKIAQCFRREFEYDFVQYGDNGNEQDENSMAYIWFDGYPQRGVLEPVFGACCFRFREWSDHPACWSLDWIWFHPYQRRKGHLTKAWPYFKSRFKDFHVAPPISKGMESFIKKNEL